MRATKPIVCATVVAALAGVSVASASTYRDGPLKATFRARTHHPNCKQKWPVTITASFRGRPAHATAYYQFMYGGMVVGTQYPFSNTRRNRHNRIWHFHGHFTDRTFGPFGALAVGHSITVRAVVRDGRYTAYPSYSVRVVKVRGCRAVH